MPSSQSQMWDKSPLQLEKTKWNIHSFGCPVLLYASQKMSFDNIINTWTNGCEKIEIYGK